MGELVKIMRTSDYVQEGFSDTVSETAQTAGKSILTALYTIPLLKPPSGILKAIRNEGRLKMRGHEDRKTERCVCLSADR